ncbi:hypothetical protein KA013_00460 [Patescibacteria group bacterium]|nr:hypothetical protein [Patescibacteria group bacterium]
MLIGIAETRQVLIDFSVDRHSKCAKCRQDNYDFYPCKLKMLCFDLPVLPIPNFHIPDIYLDLSEINIGIDIIIPHFQFVPRKFSFPRLPELPDPRDIEIEINIPDIPVLPLPPPLPDLPELDMDIDLELPTLPPPPKLPKIAPAIKVVVKIADFIGTLLCLVKGSI